MAAINHVFAGHDDGDDCSLLSNLKIVHEWGQYPWMACLFDGFLVAMRWAEVTVSMCADPWVIPLFMNGKDPPVACKIIL